MCHGAVTLDGLPSRKTKFERSQLLPLHETEVAGLGRYVAHVAARAGIARGCTSPGTELDIGRSISIGYTKSYRSRPARTGSEVTPTTGFTSVLTDRLRADPSQAPTIRSASAHDVQ
jgi:hypothetical protein